MDLGPHRSGLHLYALTALKSKRYKDKEKRITARVDYFHVPRQSVTKLHIKKNVSSAFMSHAKDKVPGQIENSSAEGLYHLQQTAWCFTLFLAEGVSLIFLSLLHPRHMALSSDSLDWAMLLEWFCISPHLT